MRSRRERVIHAVLFEALAVAMVAPALTAITGAGLADTFLLSVLVSVGAVTANYIWTRLFDRWVPTRQRGGLLRLAQAIGLELILTTYTVPLFMLFTGSGLWEALVLDFSGVAFFIVFGAAYNALFDAVWLRIAREF